jgi:carbon storage regulator
MTNDHGLEHPGRKESTAMLVLSRRLNESIIIDGNIRITIVGIRGNHVRVGIEAPESVPIRREELKDRFGRLTSPEPSTSDVLASEQTASHSA